MTETGGQILPGDNVESQGSTVVLVTSTFQYDDPVAFTAKILSAETTTDAGNPLLPDDLIPVTKVEQPATDIESSGDGQPAEGEPGADGGADSTRTSSVTPCERDRWSVSNLETEFETEITPSNVSIASEFEEYARNATGQHNSKDDETTTHIVVNGNETNAPGRNTSVSDDSLATVTQSPAADVYVDETTTVSTIPNITQSTTDTGAATTNFKESNPVIEKLGEPFVHAENNLERVKNASEQHVGDGIVATTEDVRTTTQVENIPDIIRQTTTISNDAVKMDETAHVTEAIPTVELDSSTKSLFDGTGRSQQDEPIDEKTASTEIPLLVQPEENTTSKESPSSTPVPVIEVTTNDELSTSSQKLEDAELEDQKTTGTQFLTTIPSLLNPPIEVSSTETSVNSTNTEEPDHESTETEHPSMTSQSSTISSDEIVSEDSKITTAIPTIETLPVETPINVPETEKPPNKLDETEYSTTLKSSTANLDEKISQEPKSTTIISGILESTSETPIDTTTPSPHLEEPKGSASYTERVIVEIVTSISHQENSSKEHDNTEKVILESSTNSEDVSTNIPVSSSSKTSKDSLTTPETDTTSMEIGQEVPENQKTSTATPLPEQYPTFEATETTISSADASHSSTSNPVFSSSTSTLIPPTTEKIGTVPSFEIEPTLPTAEIQPTKSGTRNEFANDAPIEIGTLTPEQSSTSNSFETTTSSTDSPPPTHDTLSTTLPPVTSKTTISNPTESPDIISTTATVPESTTSSEFSEISSTTSFKPSETTSLPSSTSKVAILEDPDDGKALNQSSALPPPELTTPSNSNCTSSNTTTLFQPNCTATTKEIRLQTPRNKTTTIIIRTRPITSSSRYSCTSNFDCPRMRICLNKICTLKNDSQLAKPGHGLSLAETSDFRRGICLFCTFSPLFFKEPSLIVS